MSHIRIHTICFAAADVLRGEAVDGRGDAGGEPELRVLAGRLRGAAERGALLLPGQPHLPRLRRHEPLLPVPRPQRLELLLPELRPHRHHRPQ